MANNSSDATMMYRREDLGLDTSPSQPIGSSDETLIHQQAVSPPVPSPAYSSDQTILYQEPVQVTPPPSTSQPKKRKPKMLLWGLGIAVMVILIGAVAGGGWVLLNLNRQPTTVPTQVAEVEATVTPTATPEPTHTLAAVTATPTLKPVIAVATPTSLPSPTPRWLPSPTLVEPLNGSYASGDETQIALQWTNTTLKDDEFFVVRVLRHADKTWTEYWRKDSRVEIEPTLVRNTAGTPDGQYSWSVQIMACTGNCGAISMDNVAKEGIPRSASSAIQTFYWYPTRLPASFSEE